MNETLAIKYRPDNLAKMIGQKHLVGQDGIILKLVETKKLPSVIFYGLPGIGKSSLANAIVKQMDVEYRELNAVINNKKDFLTVFEESKTNKGMIVIIDEIHRLNKDKQDLLLPYIENSFINIIGLTSLNPFHKINPSIRSRCQIFELKPLTKAELLEGIENIIAKEKIIITKEAIDAIISLANYDFRNVINTLEIAFLIEKKITLDTIKKINQKPIHLSDASDDNYYDLLSALQKSIRGSDVDASLYYLGRLLIQEDLESIFRRLTVIAYEDIGLANPQLQTRTNLAINACERIGMPEARIILANIVIELAIAPKSNSAYLAIDQVLNDLENGMSYPIPKHLKTNSNQYKYPHDYPFALVKQQYLPAELIKKYYHPKNNKNERNFQEIISNIKKST